MDTWLAHGWKLEYVSSSKLTTWLLLGYIKRRTIVICIVGTYMDYKYVSKY